MYTSLSATKSRMRELLDRAAWLVLRRLFDSSKGWRCIADEFRLLTPCEAAARTFRRRSNPRTGRQRPPRARPRPTATPQRRAVATKPARTPPTTRLPPSIGTSHFSSTRLRTVAKRTTC